MGETFLITNKIFNCNQLPNFRIVANSQPCKEFDISDPSKCPYIYFGRPSRTSGEIIVDVRSDLPLKMVPYWDQIEGSAGPVPNCDVFSNSSCLDKYCC